MIRTNSRVRIFLVLPALALILAAFSAWCSGCLMLAIPSAAYEGYTNTAKVRRPVQTSVIPIPTPAAIALTPTQKWNSHPSE